MFRTPIDALSPSGTGLKSRLSACFLSASKSCPAIAKSAFAASSESQPSIAARPMFLFFGDKAEPLAQEALDDGNG